MAQNNNVTKTPVGRIRDVQGQVITLVCDGQYRPALRELLKLERDETISFEAYSYENDRVLHCLLLSDNTVPIRGDRVYSTGGEITIPMGSEVLGRAIDLFGNPEDGRGPVETPNWRSIHSNAGDLEMDESTNHELIETGIKAIDFFAPMKKGGKILLVGGAGVGKTVLMTEIFQGLVSNHEGASIFAGIGERSREGHELWKWLDKKGLLEQIVLVLGNIHRNAAVRFRTAWAATAMAEYFRDVEEKDVLFFVDNVYRFLQAGSELSNLAGEIPSEFGYQPTLQSEIAQFESRLKSTKKGSVTSVQTMYVPADELSDPSIAVTVPHVDSVVILSRDIAQQGRLPAVDYMQSSTSLFDPAVIGEKHYQVLTDTVDVLQEHDRLARIVAIVGKDEISTENRIVYERGQMILNYLTQPFFAAEVQTGRSGVFVPREKTVDDIWAILVGKYDGKNPNDFLYIGGLE